MKHLTLISTIFLLISICTDSQAQNIEFTKEHRKMPPMSMLPKKDEVKHMYKLPKHGTYYVFTIEGKLLETGTAEWIDITNYRKGTYFLQFDKKTTSFEVSKSKISD